MQDPLNTFPQNTQKETKKPHKKKHTSFPSSALIPTYHSLPSLSLPGKWENTHHGGRTIVNRPWSFLFRSSSRRRSAIVIESSVSAAAAAAKHLLATTAEATTKTTRSATPTATTRRSHNHVYDDAGRQAAARVDGHVSGRNANISLVVGGGL